jgi:hypothetical protein
MTTLLQLVYDTVGPAGLLYAATITISVITVLATPDPDQRRAALKVLALLVRGKERDSRDQT